MITQWNERTENTVGLWTISVWWLLSTALQIVIQTSYSWHLLAQKSFQLPPPKLMSNDYSSTVFEFPKQLHLPLGQVSLPDSLNSLDQKQTPLVSPGLETSKFLLSLHALIMHTCSHSIHIHCLCEIVWDCCIHNYCIFKKGCTEIMPRKQLSIYWQPLNLPRYCVVWDTICIHRNQDGSS